MPEFDSDGTTYYEEDEECNLCGKVLRPNQHLQYADDPISMLVFIFCVDQGYCQNCITNRKDAVNQDIKEWNKRMEDIEQED